MLLNTDQKQRLKKNIVFQIKISADVKQHLFKFFCATIVNPHSPNIRIVPLHVQLKFVVRPAVFEIY